MTEQLESVHEKCREQHAKGCVFVIDGMNNGRHSSKFIEQWDDELFQVLHGVTVRESESESLRIMMGVSVTNTCDIAERLSEMSDHKRNISCVQSRKGVQNMCDDDRKKLIARGSIEIVVKGIFTLDTLSGKFWGNISGAQLDEEMVRAA